VITFDFYFSDVSEAARAYNEQSCSVGIPRARTKILAICEAVQRGLKSRAIQGWPALSAAEAGGTSSFIVVAR